MHHPASALQSECCQEAGGVDCLLGWADLAQCHGVISLDVFEHGGDSAPSRLALAGGSGSSSGVGAATPKATPAAPLARRQLRKMLSIVAEDAGEWMEAAGAEAAALQQLEQEEEGREIAGSGDAVPPAATGGVRRPAELLAAAAAAGLVPRPGSGCHLTTAGGDGCAALLHLDAIPFTIRYGTPCGWEILREG